MAIALVCDACGQTIPQEDAVIITAQRSGAEAVQWHAHPVSECLGALQLKAPQPLEPVKPTAWAQTVANGEEITDETPKTELEVHTN